MKKFKIFSILVSLLACWATTAWTGSLPDTGQILSYTATFGEDSDYLINPPSYTKLDDQGNPLPDAASNWVMVRDNRTGLIWQVKEASDGPMDYSNPHDVDNLYWWYDSNPATNGGVAGTPGDGDDTEDFLNALNGSNFGGFSDWRLPTAKELASIMDSDSISPAINTQYFPNVQGSSGTRMYWTSTTEVSFPYRAWLGYFNAGTIACNGLKSDAGPPHPAPEQYLARAVRGSWSSNSFVDNGDGTTTDTSTGLMWQKDPVFGSANWEDAINYCENLTLAGYSDWRLPNKIELQSIIDYQTYNPAIDTTYFITGSTGRYWTSTTAIYHGNWYAWEVSIWDGDVEEEDKDDSDLVRAVRGIGSPTVTLTNPDNAEIDVAVTQNIGVSFSEVMDAATVTTASFIVNDGAGNISGTVDYNGVVAVFSPTSDLDYDTTYTATITTDAEDLDGNPLIGDYIWSFTTESDTTPPTVDSTGPVDGATDVAVNTTVTATFSENMDASTIDTNTFSLDNGVTGTVNYSAGSMMATFTPSANLAYSTTYTATITTGVEDLALNPLQADYTWSFTTVAAPDTTPPTVTSTNPVNNATGVAVDAAISATFSEDMDASTIDANSFTLNNGASCTVSYNAVSRTATCTPTADLNDGTTYTATITTGVEDSAGNPLQANSTWSFTAQATQAASVDDEVAELPAEPLNCFISTVAYEPSMTKRLVFIAAIFGIFLIRFAGQRKKFKK